MKAKGSAMTNKTQSQRQEKEKIRNSFGISHPDIISAHLQMRRLSTSHLSTLRIKESADRQKDYYLLPDYRVEKEITEKGEAICMISFQVRKNGLFAVARLYDQSREEKKGTGK